jgi:nicotinamidase-related amidase
MKANETAVVLIEFQNDFCKEGGKLHGGSNAGHCQSCGRH